MPGKLSALGSWPREPAVSSGFGVRGLGLRRCGRERSGAELPPSLPRVSSFASERRQPFSFKTLYIRYIPVNSGRTDVHEFVQACAGIHCRSLPDHNAHAGGFCSGLLQFKVAVLTLAQERHQPLGPTKPARRRGSKRFSGSAAGSIKHLQRINRRAVAAVRLWKFWGVEGDAEPVFPCSILPLPHDEALSEELEIGSARMLRRVKKPRFSMLQLNMFRHSHPLMAMSWRKMAPRACHACL